MTYVSTHLHERISAFSTLQKCRFCLKFLSTSSSLHIYPSSLNQPTNNPTCKRKCNCTISPFWSCKDCWDVELNGFTFDQIQQRKKGFLSPWKPSTWSSKHLAVQHPFSSFWYSQHSLAFCLSFSIHKQPALWVSDCLLPGVTTTCWLLLHSIMSLF